MEIEFINTSGLPLDPPYPSVSSLPEWYKNTASFFTDDGKPRPSLDPFSKDETTATIKKCVPVFDALTAGYIITTPVDVYVSQQNGQPFYSWPDLNFISIHPLKQAPLHPEVFSKKLDIPKFGNPWGIKTSKGTSCLFVAPMHRESPVSILPGIVDTDTYHLPVLFPFMLKDQTFEGLIPEGTPIVQIIPFKRDSWKSQVTEKSREEVITSFKKPVSTTFFNVYRNKFWIKKNYK